MQVELSIVNIKWEANAIRLTCQLTGQFCYSNNITKSHSLHIYSICMQHYRSLINMDIEFVYELAIPWIDSGPVDGLAPLGSKPSTWLIIKFLIKVMKTSSSKVFRIHLYIDCISICIHIACLNVYYFINVIIPYLILCVLAFTTFICR